ncbi:MAG: SusC/RagA family TonB-linked outer membrane protein [Tannerella sp.]|nr:SusC/RagA family TonB-linked outer membrane protein [Tannerella sp.]
MDNSVSVAVIQQKRTITGTVVDKIGEPVIGANVVEKGTTNGIITDIDGRFTINVENNVTLKISYIGYVTQEITPGNQSQLNIVLLEDLQALDEVIVIGYGTARRQDYTGSVSSVKLENSAMSVLPNLNVLETLKGNVAGVNIGATGSSGEDPSMLIRGQNSINGSNDPLIVLDGVIFMGKISDINPNDIASIDVLKDAVSSAVYGSRAANGIIAISTKKGHSEKPMITLNTSLGFHVWQDEPKMMNGERWLRQVNDVAGNTPGSTSVLTAKELDNYNNGSEVSWLDEVSRTGTVQEYQLAVSGSAKGLNYYLSTSYNDHKGIIRGDDYNRISILAKINADITSWLNIGVDASFSRRDYPEFIANMTSAQTSGPYSVMYRDQEGNLERWPRELGTENPLWGVSDGTTEKNGYP